MQIRHLGDCARIDRGRIAQQRLRTFAGGIEVTRWHASSRIQRSQQLTDAAVVITEHRSPDAQGLGIGTLLLAELLARCEAQGFRQMIAVIGDAATNLASARLHALMGFTECGRIKGSGFKFNRWCDTLLMQRALNGGIDTLPV